MNNQPQTPVRTPFVRSFARTLATQSPERKSEIRVGESWLDDDQALQIAIGDAAHPIPGPSHIAPSQAAPTASPSAPAQPYTQRVAQDHSVASQQDRRSVTQQSPNVPVTRVHANLSTMEKGANSKSAPASQAEVARVDDPPLQKQVHDDTITPAWEVDVFEIPSTVADLFFEGKLFADLGSRISEAAMGGLRSMLVTSTDSGEGRSTIAIGMALAAAASGLRVALVDADVQSPTLVDDLRLDIQYGWIESIRNGLPIGEIAVYSIEDNVTLIPLLPASSSQPEPNPAETIQLIERLSDHFDMIIIDGPPSDSSPLYRMAPIVDSAIIVCDVARISPNTIQSFAFRLKEAGVKGVGVVENFVI